VLVKLRLEARVTLDGHRASPRAEFFEVTVDTGAAAGCPPAYHSTLAYLLVRTLGLKLEPRQPEASAMADRVEQLLVAAQQPQLAADEAWGWRPVGARYVYCPFASRDLMLAAIREHTTHGQVEVGRVHYVHGAAGTGGLEEVETITVERPPAPPFFLGGYP
jgi:hypothetical protein